MTTLEKLEELIYTGFKETDRKFQETDRKFKETDREISEIGRQVRDITDSLGRFAENMIAPAIVKLFNEKGIPITDYAQQVRSPKRRIEYDIVAFNDNYVVVVSVKMTLRVEHVQHFLNDRLPIFKEVFPRYKDMKVIGAVAGASEKRLKEELKRIEEEFKMPYLASWERSARKEGINDEKIRTAKEMLKEGFGLDTIAKITGLSKEKIEKLISISH